MDVIKTLWPILADLISSSPLEMERLGRGRNNRTFKFSAENGQVYIAKWYYDHQLDGRDRLEVEYSCLNFLRRHHISEVPRPIARNREKNIAVYSFIEGKEVDCKEVCPADIDNLVEFLVKLNRLSKTSASFAFPNASEACFSVTQILSNLNDRLSRFSTPKRTPPQQLRLLEFLRNHFIPFLKRVIRWIETDEKRKRWMVPIPRVEQTLSPSDFGFHNAVRTGDGRLAFVDFEYFGWDDPAKLISDFLLHPAMSISENLKKRFVKLILSQFPYSESLFQRLTTVYPLFGLKWCLILLNEFLPEHLARRQFSSHPESDVLVLREKQLHKAQQMLKKIKDEFERFPYQL